MKTFDPILTIGDMVTQRPHLSRVFEKFGIDYCCGGGKTLPEACADREIDPDTVWQALEATQSTSVSEADYSTMSMTELADHIETIHHVYLRQELPRLERMAQKVAKVHGQNHPETRELVHVFVGLRMELEKHMIKEEQVLFPAIRQMEGEEQAVHFPFGTLANPIRMMEQEHDNAGNALGRIRELTRDFLPPDDACNTYRALFDGLRELELDMHQHIHKENNVLFPRAMEMEDRKGAT